MENHNYLGYEWLSGLDFKQPLDVHDVIQPTPGLIGCAGVTRSVSVTCHVVSLNLMHAIWETVRVN